jgi:predicted flap endonuclease-1-like 5' DNA nuclease
MASYPISDLDGLDEDMAAELRALGIRTTAKLLDAAKNPKGRKLLAQKTSFTQRQILHWANMADRMRIKGMGKGHAQLLQAAGVDTVKELKYRNPSKLARAMREANNRRKLVRLMPSEKAIVRWIEQAKKLPLKITY